MFWQIPNCSQQRSILRMNYNEFVWQPYAHFPVTWKVLYKKNLQLEKVNLNQNNFLFHRITFSVYQNSVIVTDFIKLTSQPFRLCGGCADFWNKRLNPLLSMFTSNIKNIAKHLYQFKLFSLRYENNVWKIHSLLLYNTIYWTFVWL